MFKLAAPRIQFEISSVVFKDFHVPTVAFLFAWSLLVPGAWPLPQTPYIFTPLFSLILPVLLPGVFFLFYLKCKVLFKYCFHHEVFLCSVGLKIFLWSKVISLVIALSVLCFRLCNCLLNTVIIHLQLSFCGFFGFKSYIFLGRIL